MANPIFTIGHSTHSSNQLLELLSRHGVTAVADVRSQPFSRVNPQFNRDTLKAHLRGAGIFYVFLGRELGARAEDPNCYVNGKVQYDKLAQTDLFQHGLTRVERGSENFRIALLCAEKDPLVCHRSILVSRHLVARGFHVVHIREGGQTESHEDALTRLLRETGMPDRELFKTRDEMIAEAYRRRGQEISYVDKSAAS